MPAAHPEEFRRRAVELARLLRGRPALLNVIPYNPVQGLPYVTPDGLARAAARWPRRSVRCTAGAGRWKSTCARSGPKWPWPSCAPCTRFR